MSRSLPVFLLVWFVGLSLVATALVYTFLDGKTVQGRVLDPDGAPIAGAVVTLAGRSALADSSGAYQLQVPRGRWELVGFANGYRSASVTLDLQEVTVRNFTADLVLEPLEVYGGVTIDETPQPLPPAPAELRVAVVDESTRQPIANSKVQAGAERVNADGQGYATLHGLMLGTAITATAEGYADEHSVYDGSSELTFALRPVALNLTVLDAATGKPVTNTLVLYNNTARPVTAEGAFRFDGSERPRTLQLKAPRYLLATVQLGQGGNREARLTPFKTKGIHLYYGIKRQAAVDLLEKFRGTELNTLVWDVKEDPGYILWDSQVALAKAIGAYRPRDFTAPDMIKVCRDYRLYCIARLSVFKDSLLANSRPALALHRPNGAVFNDGAAAWTNPARSEVQQYALDLMRELALMGFDEVQVDYIRYPGNADIAELGTAKFRIETIAGFLSRAAELMRPLPAFFSGDLFGLTTATDDEQKLGQVLETTAPHFDYVSPMMYPATWKGASYLVRFGLRLPNCSDANACPRDVIRQGVAITRERVPGARVRPWLQAYVGTGFTLREYLLQAQGAEDAASEGYLYWNNLAVYPDGLFAKIKPGPAAAPQ